MRLLVTLAGLAISLALPTGAQQNDTTASPKSEQAKQIVALVEKAAALIDSKGKSIFPEFRKTDSEWRTGDTYLFVNDLKGMVLLNPAFPELEGKDLTGRKDSNGKLFFLEFLKVVQSKGSGWVDYMFPKPGQSQPSQKWSYVKAVNVNGTPALVGAGFYATSPTASPTSQ
jgi:cytochrome c